MWSVVSHHPPKQLKETVRLAFTREPDYDLGIEGLLRDALHLRHAALPARWREAGVVEGRA